MIISFNRFIETGYLHRKVAGVRSFLCWLIFTLGMAGDTIRTIVGSLLIIIGVLDFISYRKQEACHEFHLLKTCHICKISIC